MFKKILAVTLAAIIMITPMTASAVTWGTVVAQLNASGSYSGEGIEASVSDGAVTVQGSTGATIEGDIDEWHETPTVNIYVDHVAGANKYAFQDVTINDNVQMSSDGVGLEVTFGAGTTVNADLVDVGAFNGGTTSFTNEGTINAEIGSWADTGSLEVTNNGTVNGDMGGAFGGEESGPTTGTVVNNGTVTGNMHVYAFENGTATGVVGKNGVVEGELSGGSGGNATLTNNGAVGSMTSWAEDGGTTKAVNNGEVGGEFAANAYGDSTASATNNGHVADRMVVTAVQNGNASGVNKGAIDGTLFSSIEDWDEEQDAAIANVGSATVSVVNDGEVGRMLTTLINGEGTVTGVNNGTIHMNINSLSYGGTGVSATTNNGDVEGEIYVEAENGGSAQLVNNGTIANDTYVTTWSDGSAQMNNLGTIGGESWTQAIDGGVAETVNNGEIKGVMASYVAAGGQTNLVNNGSVPGVTAEFEVNEKGQTGTTAVTGSGDTGKLTVGVYAAPDVDVSTAEARQKIADDVASGLTVYAGQLGLTEGNATVKVVIYDEEGNEVDTVEAEVPLEPVPKPEEEYKPSEWEIRHEMEEKRKAESLAGVYASPYWCRQMYLGYHSLNFRVYDAADKNVLIRERLSWIDGGPRKNLNLRVRTDETAGLTIRFDEEVLDILERAEIDTITLLTYTEKEPFMQYKTSDLRAAFTQFGLARTDLLVIGGMDDEVMKIGADGKMVPVE